VIKVLHGGINVKIYNKMELDVTPAKVCALYRSED